LFTDSSKDDCNDIAQAKSSKLKGDAKQTKKQNAEQCHATRFSERLIKHSNDQKNENSILGEDDDIAASKTECKYCKHVYGSSGLYPIGGYLRRHQGTKNCGINFVDINEWNSDEEHNREYNSAKKRLIHPCSRIRDVYSSSQIKISVNEDEVNHNDFSDVFAFNHQHSNMFDYDFSFKISKGFPKSCNIIGLITSRNQEKLK